MILDDIVAAKKKRLVRHKENVSEQDIRLVLYTTDFEHTIRDNSDYEVTVDLSQSKMTLPY